MVQATRLTITHDRSGWHFTLTEPSGAPQVFTLTPSKTLAGQLAGYFAGIRIAVNDAALQATRLENYLRATPVPNQLKDRLRKLGRTRPESVLLIHAEEPFTRVPWEFLLTLWGTPLRVVRLVAATAAAPASTTTPPARALLVVSHTMVNDEDARREFEVLKQLLAPRIEFTCLECPTLELVRETCAREAPQLIHWIGQGSEADGSYKVQAFDAQGQPGWYAVDAVAASLASQRPAMIFLNMCGSGQALAQAVTRQSPTAVVLGWYGNVLSPVAADVALTLYSRWRVGEGLLAAVATALAGRFDAALLVSTSSPDSLEKTWLQPCAQQPAAQQPGARRDGFESAPSRSPPERPMRGSSPPPTSPPAPALTPTIPLAPLELDWDLNPAICPAMLINGRSPIKCLRLIACPARTRVRVSLTCDTGHSTSTWSELVDLKEGVTAWQVDSINFPSLHELLLQPRIQRRQINVTLTVADGATILAESTRKTTYLSPTEWLDDESAWPYIPSYVLPDSTGAKAVIDAATTHLVAKLGGKAFDGRAEKADLDLQVSSLYEALKQSFELRYVSPPGAPVYILGRTDEADVESAVVERRAGQRVRFPNEVTEFKSGTCHDLALLLAACAEYVNILPLLVLIPGHTLFGYWRVRSAHRRFWEARRTDSARNVWIGDRWVFRDTRALTRLVEADDVRLVETVAATLAGGQADFDTACTRGLAHFAVHGQPLSCAVDIWSARRYVEPIYRASTQE